ncbi:MAG: CHAT domain-containing tetratricopeptide repeat protein [Gemmatimonadales bacterium]|nr:CHAT domain-containing tetratricopeptide repeat protein [Gemmatimonadales bacterium]
MFTRADSLYGAEEYDSARATWQRALAAARAAGAEEAEARILTELGFTAWRLGEPAEARRLQERALEIKERLGLAADRSRSLNGLGLIAWDEGQLSEAVGHFEAAVASARAVGDTAALARASGNLGLPLMSLGEYGRAREAFRILRAAGRAIDNDRFQGNALANEATLDIWEGDPVAGIARLDSARTFYRRNDYATGEQNALAQLGTAFERTGELDRAFAAFDSSLALARLLALDGQQADLSRLIGGLHASVGDWRQAIRFFERADTLFQSAGLTRDRGAALRGAAEGYLALDNVPLARARGEAALALDQQSGGLVETLDDHLFLADLESRMASGSAANRHLDAAEALADRLGSRGSRLAVGLAAARVAARVGSAAAALAGARRLDSLLLPGDLWAEWEVHALTARAHARMMTFDSAVAAGRRAVAALERLRGNLGNANLRTTLIDERSAVYGDLVVALLRLGRSGEAFAVADAARSRALLDYLSGASSRQFAELAQGQVLLRRIDGLLQRLRTANRADSRERTGEPVAVAEVTDALASARSEYEALLVRAQARYPRAMAILGAVPARLEEVRATLEPNEALIEYLIAGNRILIFVARSDGLRLAEVAVDPNALAHRTETLSDLWGTRREDWRIGVPVAEALHRDLIEPLGSLEGVDRLIIVPHGILSQVPFAALRRPDTGTFLVQRFAISILPSAAALVALRRGRAGPAALAEGQALAPFPRGLPATAREVAAFRAALGGGRTLVGDRATEASLRRVLGTAVPVHVASHGTRNTRNPMFSRIELARPSAVPGPDDDGRLEVHELMGLGVRAPLVFFSGCETGRGPRHVGDPARGTAHLSLAQATLTAGAANVISTLWRIDDDGAAEFAAAFYHRLRERTVTEALTATQREFLGSERRASPYYWAGYTLSGEGRFGGKSAQERTRASVSLPENPERPTVARSHQ